MASEASTLLSKDGPSAHTALRYGAEAQATETWITAVDRIDAEEDTGALRTSIVAVVILMAIGIFVASMDGTIVVASYASIGSELNQLQSTSWIVTSYLLTTACSQPLSGKLSDIFGRKSCLLLSYVIFGLGCLLCGVSRNMTELIAGRALSGLGGGGMQTVVNIIVSDMVPLRSRGIWQGIMNIVWASGNSSGATLGGIFTDTIGWRWGFLIQVPIALIAFISVSTYLHRPSAELGDFKSKLRRVDFLGAITLTATIFLLLLGLDRGGNFGWTDPMARSCLTGFAFSAVAFTFVELEWAREPISPKGLIVNRSLIASYLSNFFAFAAAFAVHFQMPLYLQAVQGETASQTSMVLLLPIVGVVVGSLSVGLIMKVTGRYYKLTLAVYLLHFFGILIVAMTSGAFAGSSSSGIAIGFLISNLGHGAGLTTSLTSIVANAGPEDQAVATAVSFLFRTVGAVLGLSLGSSIVQTTLRSTLRERLAGQDIDEIIRRVRESLSYLDDLEPVSRVIVRSSYGTAIHATFLFSVGIGALCVFSSFYIVEKPLPSKK